MPYPDVSVEGEPVVDDRAFAPAVAARRGFSAEAPALVDVELTNETDGPVEISLAWLTPFDAMTGHATDGRGAIYLVPGAGSQGGDERVSLPQPRGAVAPIPAEPIDGCWRVSRPPFIRESGKLWTADPGESLRRAHAVLDGPDSETCLRPGTYRFEVGWQETRMRDLRGVLSEQRYRPAGDGESYSWAFTVTLHE